MAERDEKPAHHDYAKGDLWGTALTESEVDAADFGVAVNVDDFPEIRGRRWALTRKRPVPKPEG